MKREKPIVDWDSAKALYIKGLPLKDVAEQMGVKFGTLRQHARRSGWMQVKRRTSEIVSQVVSESVTQGAKSHVHRVLNLVNRHIESVERRHPDDLDLESFDMLTKIVDRLDQIGRRSHGIDAEAQGKASTTLVQVVINTQDTSAFHEIEPVTSTPDTTIDVEPSSSDAQSTGAEQGQA
jgi:hypothetical protein